MGAASQLGLFGTQNFHDCGFPGSSEQHSGGLNRFIFIHSYILDYVRKRKTCIGIPMMSWEQHMYYESMHFSRH